MVATIEITIASAQTSTSPSERLHRCTPSAVNLALVLSNNPTTAAASKAVSRLICGQGSVRAIANPGHDVPDPCRHVTGREVLDLDAALLRLEHDAE